MKKILSNLTFGLTALLFIAPIYITWGAVLTVTTTADSGPGSLREAVGLANGGDTIVFAPALNGSTITISSGRIEIDTNMVIAGPGAGQLFITNSDSVGIFRIDYDNPDRTYISGLDFINVVGDYGAVIQSFRPTIIADCRFDNGYAFDDAGAIMSFDTLWVYNSTFNSNEAGDDAGAIMTFEPAMIQGNCLFSGNSAGDDAGAIMAFDTLWVDHTVFDGNSAGDDAGVIMTFDEPVLLTYCYFLANTAGAGGGAIMNFAQLFTINSLFEDNMAGGSGGAITNFEDMACINTTFSGNTASYSGGAVYNFGPTRFTFCTLTANYADSIAGAVHHLDTTLILHNTIVADNGANNFAPDLYAEGGTIISAGGNLIGVIDSAKMTTLPSDISGSSTSPEDPLLDVLADNGGPTKTHALLPGSPAIDSGTQDTVPQTDQRGYPRPHNGIPDRGAYEFGSHPIGVSEVSGKPFAIQVFPNPAGQWVWIELEDEGIPIRLSVFNVLGQKVRQPLLLNRQVYKLDLSGLSEPLYLLHFQTGDQSATRKLIIHR